MFKKKIQELKNKVAAERKNIIPIITALLVSAVLFLAYHFLGNYLLAVTGVITVLLLGILLSVFMFIAGFAVLKSLFLFAGELSLLIFLAQSYCDVQNRSVASAEALKNLLIFGLIFIGFNFCRLLYQALNKNFKIIENDKWSGEKIVTVSLYLFFTGLFLWQIYLVMNPIILDLCVFK